MRRYRTEILIPPDRTVVLQLPTSLPAGWATVTVQYREPEPENVADSDPDRQDIEWWDEFDEDEEKDSDADEGDVEAR